MAACWIPVTMYPGSMRITCTPKGYNSRRSALLIASRANLLLLYAPCVGAVTNPETELIITMRPRLRSRMCGSHGLRDAQNAEEIRFELAAPILEAQVFDGSGEIDAGVVDEEIDGTCFRENCGRNILDGCVVAYIQLQSFQRQLLIFSQRIELGAFFRRAARGENTVATFREQKRRGSAQSICCAGDQHGFLKFCLVLHFRLQLPSTPWKHYATPDPS